MIAEIGRFALTLALMIACFQAVLPLIGVRQNNPLLMAFARPAALGQFLFVAIAFLSLTYLFVVSDFSVASVAANSHSAKPLLYKVSGVWGNHEGSMLLWVLILALFSAAVALFGNSLPAGLSARVLSVQAMIGIGFLSFIILTSNPFDRLHPAPPDGNGLNPLLQDPGLAFHPPFLYLGYVGFSVAFSFCIAALMEGKVDAAWARWVRPWVLAAWCFLTVGITLGSVWAYYELGWGGWWFWDPVENASFMPWLAGTALLHSAIVVERRQTLVSWTILLGILTFSLSLVGTFLVRSGVLSSVHAFAVDPERGVFILGLLVLATGGSLLLFALKAPALKRGGLFSTVSREASLTVNNVLLLSATATVFIGTFYPLVIDAIGDDKISVGPPYYNMTFAPIMALLFVVMVAGPMLKWRRDGLKDILKRLTPTGILAFAVFTIVAVLSGGTHLLAAAGLGLAAYLLIGTVAGLGSRVRLFQVPAADSWWLARRLPRSAYAMIVAHAGMSLTIAGITAMSAWQQEKIVVMQPGDHVSLSGYEVTLTSVTHPTGPNYQAERGHFAVTQNQTTVAMLTSERRFYPVRGMETTEAGIRSNLISNVYIALGEQSGQGGWTVRLYYHPLAPWIWIGALIMASGGLLSLTDRRFRIGAPAKAKPGRAVPAPAD